MPPLLILTYVGFVSLGLLVAGLGLAPVFPTLISRTPHRLHEGHAAHAIGFQVSAAMLGGAALPTLGGVLAACLGLEAIGALAVAIAAALWQRLRGSAGTRLRTARGRERPRAHGIENRTANASSQ